MLETLQNIDAEVFLFFNSAHCTFFDSFMSLYSGKFIWIPMYASLLLVMLGRFPLSKVLILLVGVALLITLADQICSSLIRPICERLRPSNPSNPLSEFVHIVNGYRGGAYGFPSCHAANSFALAAFAAVMLRRRSFTLFIITWAIINCYSRIYLGVHYPGDLIVGALIGSAIGYVCCRCSCAAWQSLLNRGRLYDAKPVLANIPAYRRVMSDRLNLMEIVGIFTIIAIILASLV